ncbi:hypothetical protein J6590_069731 [Homalodisca vitripennis]|nr:hypothetical protein J6590_069731 [Homalodisca vitripennis]
MSCALLFNLNVRHKASNNISSKKKNKEGNATGVAEPMDTGRYEQKDISVWLSRKQGATDFPCPVIDGRRTKDCTKRRCANTARTKLTMDYNSSTEKIIGTSLTPSCPPPIATHGLIVVKFTCNEETKPPHKPGHIGKETRSQQYSVCNHCLGYFTGEYLTLLIVAHR